MTQPPRGRLPDSGAPQNSKHGGRAGALGNVKVQFEHPTQPRAASFLRAAALGDAPALWEMLSRESRGLMEGSYAARSGLALARAANVGEEDADARLAEVAAPLVANLLRNLGGEAKLNATGVSAARLVSRREAYVLLLPEVGEMRFAREEDWRPSHLLGFVYDDREWRVDLGLTAVLSEEAGLPDPLGGLR